MNLYSGSIGGKCFLVASDNSLFIDNGLKYFNFYYIYLNMLHST